MRINTVLRGIEGLFIKRWIDICFLFRIKPSKLADDNNIVVSLTSYGRRVKACVPYTIYWIFKQKVKPSRIVLWLDEDNWNAENVPLRLKFLSRFGLEVRTCKDLRSYKKLVYTLQCYPDNSIVTLDDDLLYYRDLLSRLLDKAKDNPRSIVAMRYHQPAWEKKGESFLPYRKWRRASEEMKKIPCMPTTGGGTLFPPHCFNNEALNEDVFMRICPTADDVWFWCMAIYNDTKIVGIGKDMYYPIDAFYQNLHKGSALEHLNVENNSNDTQIKAVFDYYHLWQKI